MDFRDALECADRAGIVPTYDPDFIARQLTRYCNDIGADDSTTKAVVSRALRLPASIAIREGQKYARALRVKQAPPPMAGESTGL